MISNVTSAAEKSEILISSLPATPKSETDRKTKNATQTSMQTLLQQKPKGNLENRLASLQKEKEFLTQKRMEAVCKLLGAGVKQSKLHLTASEIRDAAQGFLQRHEKKGIQHALVHIMDNLDLALDHPKKKDQVDSLERHCDLLKNDLSIFEDLVLEDVSALLEKTQKSEAAALSLETLSLEDEEEIILFEDFSSSNVSPHAPDDVISLSSSPSFNLQIKEENLEQKIQSLQKEKADLTQMRSDIVYNLLVDSFKNEKMDLSDVQIREATQAYLEDYDKKNVNGLHALVRAMDFLDKDPLNSLERHCTLLKKDISLLEKLKSPFSNHDGVFSWILELDRERLRSDLKGLFSRSI